MTSFSETELFNACRTLFGPNLSLSQDFLFYLQPGGVKTAYRKLAKETHPDRSAQRDPLAQRRMTERFRDVTSAYDLLCNFLKQRNTGQVLRMRTPQAWPPPPYRHQDPPQKAQPKKPQAPPKHKAEEKTANSAHQYHQGNVPLRNLEIGIFLYYQGLISYRDLIESLVWQRTQRPKLGDIACRWGWLLPSDILTIHQMRGGPFRRFGDKAVEMGILTQRQVQTLLWFQRNQQKRLGEFFVERGILTREQVEAAAQALKEHNLQIQFAPQNQARRYS